MATGFGMTHSPYVFAGFNLSKKSVTRMSRHRYESNSSSMLLNPPTRSSCFTAWLERSSQYLSLANFPVFKTIEKNQTSNIFLVKSLSAITGFDEKLQLNTKRPQYNSSHIKLIHTELPYCTELDFMCHANVSYCCRNKDLNDFISLKSTSSDFHSKSEGNKIVARVTENRSENNVEPKEMIELEINDMETKEKPTYLRTDMQCLIRCPMCHRRLVKGILYAGKKSKQMNKCKANNRTNKPKDRIEPIRDDYNKVVPEYPIFRSYPPPICNPKCSSTDLQCPVLCSLVINKQAATEEQCTDNYNKVVPKCPNNESRPDSSCACPPWLPCPPCPPWPSCSDWSTSPCSTEKSCPSQTKSPSQSS